jgi:hypothetical protein
LADPSTVLTSLDTESTDDAYAVAYVTASQSTGFSMSSQIVDLADLQAAATQEGLNGRVITAISYMSGRPYYFSYGWSADTSTQYDVQVTTATFDGITDAAANLAGQGFIITALGGNVTDGFLLVGTKIKGDQLPRPLRSVASGEQSTQLWQPGYAQVGLLVDAAEKLTWIGER